MPALTLPKLPRSTWRSQTQCIALACNVSRPESYRTCVAAAEKAAISAKIYYQQQSSTHCSYQQVLGNFSQGISPGTNKVDVQEVTGCKGCKRGPYKILKYSI
ncbi:uncharacterized protein UHOD_11815 [Ustilago sp. UG-2017b]|nr:uncharacterized protein UHOD_11815 [Ustilago sp. UG-2017b]